MISSAAGVCDKYHAINRTFDSDFVSSLDIHIAVEVRPVTAMTGRTSWSKFEGTGKGFHCARDINADGAP